MKILAQNAFIKKNLWGEEDANLRRLRQQIYSLPHLTALVSPQNKLKYLKRFEPMDGLEPPTG